MKRSRSVRTVAVRKYRFSDVLVIGVIALGVIGYGDASLYGAESTSGPSGAKAESGVHRFSDARSQAAEFIAYESSLALTPEQSTIMNEALSSIPAPCCKEYSIATCCCPCNLAKSAWGLSKVLITRDHATAPQVSAAVREWLQFTNPRGYTGDACFTDGCDRAFDKNGCGGMNGAHVRSH